MTSDVRDTSRVNRNLESLGLSYLLDGTDSSSSVLDLLLKILLEEKGSEKITLKYNVAIFIELESAALIFSAADVELTFATFKVSDRSESGSVRSFGSGNVSQTPSPTPSHASAGDNAALTGSPTAAAVPVEARYFVIKAGSLKTIEASLSCGAWTFTCNTERKLTRVYQEGKQVVLVFSVQGSGHFQGYAHLTGDKPDHKTGTADQCFDMSGPNLSPPLPVEWIKRANIPFQATRHLLNPYNDNKRVQTSRDGQEIEPSVGETLCSLWDKIPPFVPKSTFFGALKTFQETPETTSSKYMNYHGRPIRGFSQVGYFQNYGVNYGHRGQHPK